MKVKVQCPCGTRFEFEVEPVNGRMPVAINCPVCNADATELANAIIRQQSAATPPVGIAAAPVMPPSPAAPPPPPAPPASSGLRIAKSAHAPATGGASVPASRPPESALVPMVAPAGAEGQGEGSATVQLCPKHKSEPAVDACVVCGKPICLQCMEQFGHVCSVYCRQQATQRRIYVPAYAGQKSALEAKSNARAKLISSAIALLVVAVLGLWFWYAWFARNPKIVYTISLGDKNDSPERRMLRPPEFYQLIAPNQLLTVKNKHATLLDISKNQPLWSTSLQSDSTADKKNTPGDSPSVRDYSYYPLLVAVTTNDLWLAFHTGLVRLDRQSGARKESPSLPGPILSFTEAEDSLLAVFLDRNGPPKLARVDLLDGKIQTEALAAPDNPKPVQVAGNKKRNNKHATTRAKDRKDDVKIDQIQAVVTADNGLQSGILDPDENPITPSGPSTDDADESSFLYGGGTPFAASGLGVIEFQTRLLEQKTVTRQAMKAKGKSVLDGNATASQGLELAQEMMNDAQRERTGGVETEDVSRYQVTLHRLFSGEVPDWTGEVTGPPHVYALKTLDVLVAGQTAIAFDRNNKKLWEGKLSYPMNPMNYPGTHPPVLETKDAVYVADPGVLTCFERATGSARWRLNSVGISSVQTDERGKIYLVTTTAGPDKIKFSQQHDIHEKIHPVIMKVDPATGKVLWRLESVGDNCVFSGKFLYSTWTTQTQSALKLEEGPDLHYNLDLLSPANGGIIWNFHVDNQRILKTEIEQNWILLHFEDSIYVLKFFSL
jgi:hypothetical protein